MATKKEVTSKKTKKTLVLLDAHAILHRAYHALPDFTSPKGEPTGALYGVVAMLLKIIEELKPDYVVACFDLPEPTYRHEAFEGYKAGRVKTDDALVAQIERSRDVFAAFGIPIFEHPGFEADDMLGTIVHQTKKEKDLEVVIASGDMDTMQLIDKTRVRVYTLRKGIKDTILYDEAGVKERYGFGPTQIPDYKGLRGDPSDNIPGIVGIGEKTATDLIVAFETIDKLYKALKKNEQVFVDAGIKARMIELLKSNEEEAQFSKMLATIRTDAPIVFSLPEKSWREALDVEGVLALFGELGFRTLGDRVRTLFGGSREMVEEKVAEEIDAEEVTRVGIALWVLRSDMTSPTQDEILEFGKNEGNGADFASTKTFIMSELEKNNLLEVYNTIEVPLIPVLRAMEKRGIALDVPYLATLSEKFHEELTRCERRIYEMVGQDFNINSPKQLGDVLYDTLGLGVKNQKRTATGQRSTREAELEKLQDQHPVIVEILRYRELQKLLSTYVDSLPTMVGSDGRVHTTFLQAGATTGRMASQNPNLQNIPIRTEEGRAIRSAFVAQKGYSLVSIDYSQIELRVAAIMSGDEKLIDIFVRGEDVHSGVAARVFGVAQDAVDAEMRRKAKVINFGILYGMGVNALRANLGEGTSKAEAQEFLTAYFNTFTRLAEYLEETKRFAFKNGYTETLFGRRRYFLGIRSSIPYVRASAERMAINAPIQGTAADMLRIAMIQIHARLQEEGEEDNVRMLLQVHDELVFEVREGKEKVVEVVRGILEGILKGKEDHGVPIVASLARGKNWGEMTKE